MSNKSAWIIKTPGEQAGGENGYGYIGYNCNKLIWSSLYRIQGLNTNTLSYTRTNPNLDPEPTPQPDPKPEPQPTPNGTNLALNKPISASSTYYNYYKYINDNDPDVSRWACVPREMTM